MASVCDPFTGQCHCKVSRVLGPGHFPKSPSWAPFLYHLLLWRHCPQQPFWVSGASWKLLAKGGRGERGQGRGVKLICGLVWPSAHSQLTFVVP